jgi:hypothetical protein
MRLNLGIFTTLLLGLASGAHAEPYSVQLKGSIAGTIVTPGAGNAAPFVPLQGSEAPQAATATANVATPDGAQPQAVVPSQRKSDAPMYATGDFQPSEGK